MPLHGVLIAEAQQRIRRSAGTPGSGAEKLINFVGQVVGSLNEVRPAGRVVMDMVQEHIEVVEKLGGALGGSR